MERVCELSPVAEGHLDQWGLRMEDVWEVVDGAESAGVGFARSSKAKGEMKLARSRIGEANVYVEYALDGDSCFIADVYAHRLCIISDEKGLKLGGAGEGSRWTCIACEAPVLAVEDVGLFYMDTELGEIDGLRCPSCGFEMLTEDVVEDRLYMSEKMLEAK